MNGGITIYKIASECGVSVSTVSRVLNNSPLVSAETAERVKRVIEKYHFTPSSLARGLSNKETMTLGVIVPDISNPYFASFFLQIERYALEYNYSIILCNTLYGNPAHGAESPLSELRYFRMMADKKVDGVLILGGQVDKEEISRAYVDALNDLNRSIPVVIVGQQIKDCGCVFINRNLGSGVSTAIQHLNALGNRRIGFIGGEVGVKITTARFEAYKSTLKSLSLPYDERIVAFSDYYAPDGYAAMKRVLGSGAEYPTAAIAINDKVALGAIRAIADAGLKVPDDIAIVSCDQFIDSEYIVPRLTTLDQQNDYLGKLSIIQLLSAIHGVRESVTIQQTPKLIIRESCGAQLHKSTR